MRTLNKNKQTMYYSLQVGKVPIYETDEDGNVIYYKDNDGNSYPLESGEAPVEYEKPVKFRGNIAMSGGEAQAKEYGLSIADYDAVIIVDTGALPVVQGTRIWHKSKVEYKDSDESIPDENTADYSVVKVSENINVAKYILKAIVK